MQPPGETPRSGPAPYPDETRYLQDELQWIEVRCRRLALERKLRLQTAPNPRRETRWAELLRREEALRTYIDARRDAGPPQALDRLCAALGLDDFERMVLLLAAAPCFSRTFEDTFGLLDKDGVSIALTVEVVFNFANLPFADRVHRRRVFHPDGALVRNDLIVVDLGSQQTAPRELLGADIEITSRAFSFLLGGEEGLGELVAFSAVQAPLARLGEVVLPAETRRRLEALLSQRPEYLRLRAAWGLDAVIRYGRGMLMLFYGPPGTGKTMTAHAVAEALGMKLLSVDVPTFLAHAEAGRLLPGLFREARLQNAMLFFDECEGLLRSRLDGNPLMGPLLTELERFEGVAVLATNQPWALDEALDRRILLRLRFTAPDTADRIAIWRRHLPEAMPLDEDVDLAALAGRYPLAGGYIKNAVLTALAEFLADEGATTLRQTHLEAAAAAQLARPSEVPLRMARVALPAVVLPDGIRARLEALIATARQGAPMRLCLIGPPGVGKTLCVEAIATALGRPLLQGSPEIVEARLQQAQHHPALVHIDGPPQGPLPAAVRRALRAFSGVLVWELRQQTDLPADLLMDFHDVVSLPMPDRDGRAALWREALPEPLHGMVDGLAQVSLSGGHIQATVSRARAMAGTAALDAPHVAQALAALTERMRPMGFAGDR